MTHEEAINAICGCSQTVTVLSYQEAIEGYLKLRDLTALRSNHDDVVEFAKAVLHGDEEHQAWLTEAAECWVAGKPLPKPRNIKEKSDA